MDTLGPPRVTLPKGVLRGSGENYARSLANLSPPLHRVLKAPPAAREPPPVAPITATTVGCVCPPPSLASHPTAPASMATGALTA